jgi:hypothetical protein
VQRGLVWQRAAQDRVIAASLRLEVREGVPESCPEMTANADLVALRRRVIGHMASLGGDGMSRHRTIGLIAGSPHPNRLMWAQPLLGDRNARFSPVPSKGDQMAIELRHPVLERRKRAHMYFVGRRECGIAELYAVSTNDVECLTADRPNGELGLDWRGGDTAVVELGRQLLNRAVEPPPSSELAADFARSVLAALPEQGFVLDSDLVWKWAKWASRSVKLISPELGTHRSWLARLRTKVLGGWHA